MGKIRGTLRISRLIDLRDEIPAISNLRTKNSPNTAASKAIKKKAPAFLTLNRGDAFATR
jgi:hypothetical protein